LVWTISPYPVQEKGQLLIFLSFFIKLPEIRGDSNVIPLSLYSFFFDLSNNPIAAAIANHEPIPIPFFFSHMNFSSYSILSL
jgi:hypothetical protein